MAHLREFKPQCEYKSYYPYYLPSFYSGYSLPEPEPESYPHRRYYDRYFEPTTYDVETFRPTLIYENNSQLTQLFYTVLLIAFLIAVYMYFF